MSATETIDPADIICGLKAAVTALECHHQMHLLRKQYEEKKKQKPIAPPMYMMIPVQEQPRKKVCDKEKTIVRAEKPAPRPEKVKPCDTEANLPEMRAGILYTTCRCVHRDGLQDHCPLSQCRGQPQCLNQPWPICPPANYLKKAFPDDFGLQVNS